MLRLAMADNLKKEAGISYSDLAERVGTDVENVWRWLKGKARITDDEMGEQILNYLVYEQAKSGADKAAHLQKYLTKKNKELQQELDELAEMHEVANGDESEDSFAFFQKFKLLDKLPEIKRRMKGVAQLARTLEIAAEKQIKALEECRDETANKLDREGADDEQARETLAMINDVQERTDYLLGEFRTVRKELEEMYEKLDAVRVPKKV